jgi:hypothetical protein
MKQWYSYCIASKSGQMSHIMQQRITHGVEVRDGFESLPMVRAMLRGNLPNACAHKWMNDPNQPGDEARPRHCKITAKPTVEPVEHLMHVTTIQPTGNETGVLKRNPAILTLALQGA